MGDAKPRRKKSHRRTQKPPVAPAAASDEEQSTSRPSTVISTENETQSHHQPSHTQTQAPSKATSGGDPHLLKALRVADAIQIRQDLELLEIFFGYEANNSYNIFNQNGARLFVAMERTTTLHRCCMGKHRPFTINILNGDGSLCFIIERECTCNLFLFGATVCGTKVFVKSPDKELYGKVVQNCNPCCPSFEIQDAKDRALIYITGPCCATFCPTSCCLKWCASFSMESAKGVKIGKITKKFGLEEFLHEIDADKFGATFPADLETKTKAIIIGAVLALDFAYYEDNPPNTCAVAPAFCKVIWLVILLILIITFIIFVCLQFG